VAAWELKRHPMMTTRGRPLPSETGQASRREELHLEIEPVRWNHPVQGLSASTAKAVAASDMNLPEWLAGSRFFTTDTLRHGPVAA
jgi:hypothetical protein